LRVFGSIGYIHVSNQERSKLDDKSKRYIFIGYDSSFKEYKLYNPNSGKIVINRDVEFDEEYFWDWSIQEDEKYDSFPFLEEEESRNEEFTTPSPSPTNSSTPSSSSRGSSSEMPPHMRSLQKLYEVTDNLNDDLTLYCHFVDCEPIGFEEAVKDEK